MAFAGNVGCRFLRGAERQVGYNADVGALVEEWRNYAGGKPVEGARGRSHRSVFIDGLRKRGHDIVFFKSNRDRDEAERRSTDST